MPFFTTKALRERSQRTYQRVGKSASVRLREAARERDSYTFFLSHSFHDADVIAGLADEIQNMGYSVYVDWIEDPQLDRSKVNPRTAAQLRTRMNRCEALLYASSPHASTSKWMPWEVGYVDAAKGRVAIIPIFEEDPGTHNYKGQEYLGLYPYILKARSQNGKEMLWVFLDENTYTTVDAWLRGTEPHRRS